MKSSNNVPIPRLRGIAPRVISFIALITLIVGSLPFRVPAQQNTAAQKSRLTEEKRILHVLNRLGFGARPGDVERVKAMGLEDYINLQLHPERINDAVAAAKVAELATLNMTTAELYEKFPQPGLLMKQLERRGELPAELAAARDIVATGSRSL